MKTLNLKLVWRGMGSVRLYWSRQTAVIHVGVPTILWRYGFLRRRKFKKKIIFLHETVNHTFLFCEFCYDFEKDSGEWFLTAFFQGCVFIVVFLRRLENFVMQHITERRRDGFLSATAVLLELFQPYRNCSSRNDAFCFNLCTAFVLGNKRTFSSIFTFNVRTFKTHNRHTNRTEKRIKMPPFQNMHLCHKFRSLWNKITRLNTACLKTLHDPMFLPQ